MSMGVLHKKILISDENLEYSSNLSNRVRSSDYQKIRVLDCSEFGTKPNFIPQVKPPRSYAIGHIGKSFSGDFYNRTHLIPTRIDFGTVSKNQTVEIYLWNASRNETYTLNSLTVSNVEGFILSGEGVPYALRPNNQLTYFLTVEVKGPPSINSTIQFEFSDQANPELIVITGRRAIPLEYEPETPVTETWDWLTDVLVSHDGTEQRISLRGSKPRVKVDAKYLLTTQAEVNKMEVDNLIGELQFWVPEWHYRSVTSKKTLIGETKVHVNPDTLDLRVSEFVMIKPRGGEGYLKQILEVYSDGFEIDSPFDVNIPKLSTVVTGGIATLNDGLQSSRYSVDNVAQVSYSIFYQRDRDSILKPGTSSTSTTFLGRNVLDKRPSANSTVDNVVTSGMERLDNNIGKVELIKTWDYARIVGQKRYIVNRSQDMDYWRHFFTELKGMTKAFWLPTYRKDLTLSEAATVGTQNILVDEVIYAERVFAEMPTHRWLEIETSLGVHRATVTNAVVDSGKSRIVFNPALPNSVGWEKILRISYLLPCRLSSDSVVWTHHNQYSELAIEVRTAE